jgi:hypothetical protein
MKTLLKRSTLLLALVATISTSLLSQLQPTRPLI